MPEPVDSARTRRDFLKTAGAGLLAAAAGAAGPIELTPQDKQPPHLNVPGAPGKKLGYAVVGLGSLAINQILPGFARAGHSKVTALVSGHPDKARKLADYYGVDPKSIYNYENYESMKDNPEIDIVYNVLPNSMHAEYTIRALKAGKHVLCEKPMAANAKECQDMIDAAKAADRKLMVAYRLHFEPYTQSMRDMARKQAYGKIKVIESENVQDTKAPNIRLSKELAGGPLGDVGVYCINACRFITGEEPIEATAMMLQPKDEPRFAEVPESYVFTLRFPSGALAHCACSFGCGRSNRIRVQCASGWSELEPAFGYGGQQLTVFDGHGQSKIPLPYIDHFAAEMDHLSQCVLDNKTPSTPGEEGLADQKVMDMIEQSIREGRTVRA